MARHPSIGAEIVGGIEFLQEAAKVVRSHHERWDGNGYPDGLARRGDPDRGTRVRGRGRVRRADHRPPLPAGLDARRVTREMIVLDSGSHSTHAWSRHSTRSDDETFMRIAEDIR